MRGRIPSCSTTPLTVATGDPTAGSGRTGRPFSVILSVGTLTGMTADLHATVATRLADTGQRYTASRRSLVDVLAAADNPLTVSEIVGVRSGLAQSSAYRNLAVLEASGVVHRVASSDEFARYELAEDLTGHHHHLICTSCGGVADFTVPPKVEQSLASALRSAARRSGFNPEGHRLDLIGVCASCD